MKELEFVSSKHTQLRCKTLRFLFCIWTPQKWFWLMSNDITYDQIDYHPMSSSQNHVSLGEISYYRQEISWVYFCTLVSPLRFTQNRSNLSMFTPPTYYSSVDVIDFEMFWMVFACLDSRLPIDSSTVTTGALWCPTGPHQTEVVQAIPAGHAHDAVARVRGQDLTWGLR